MYVTKQSPSAGEGSEASPPKPSSQLAGSGGAKRRIFLTDIEENTILIFIGGIALGFCFGWIFWAITHK